LFLINLLYWF